MKNQIKFWLKLLLGIVLLWFLFEKVRYQDLLEAFKFSHPSFLIVAFLILVANEFSRISRIRLLLAVKKIFYPPAQLVKIYFMSIFFSNFMPSSLGSDVARFVFFKRAKIEASSAVLISVILVDRVIGLSGLGLLFLVGLGVGAGAIKILIGTVGQFFQPPFIVLILVLAGLILAVLWRFLKKKIIDLLQETRSFIRERRVLLISLVWSVIYQLAIATVFYLLYLGLAREAIASFAPFILWVPVINLISILPFSIGGLGLREWSFVFFFSPLGVMTSELVALSLTYFIFMLIQSIFGGFLFALTKNKK